MTINNLELFFHRREGDSLVFKTSQGEEVSIDKRLLVDFLDEDKKLFLNISDQEIFGQSKEVLNEILETDE